MQIREMSYKELESIYEILSQLREELTFKEFDDLVYDMRHIDYKMIGLFEKNRLITYAGVAVQTNFYHKRHLYIYDLVTDSAYSSKDFGKEMMDYLEVYAKTAMCEKLVLSSGLEREKTHLFYEKNGFVKKSYVFIKSI